MDGCVPRIEVIVKIHNKYVGGWSGRGLGVGVMEGIGLR